MQFAWSMIGKKYGFDYWTVLPITYKTFLALPLEKKNEQP